MRRMSRILQSLRKTLLPLHQKDVKSLLNVDFVKGSQVPGTQFNWSLEPAHRKTNAQPVTKFTLHQGLYAMKREYSKIHRTPRMHVLPKARARTIFKFSFCAKTLLNAECILMTLRTSTQENDRMNSSLSTHIRLRSGKIFRM